jgi:hypothetical protein
MTVRNSFPSRLEKAHELAASGKITRSPTGFYVPSSDGITIYHVRLDERGEPSCTCPDFQRRQAACYHALGCGLIAEQERGMSKA